MARILGYIEHGDVLRGDGMLEPVALNDLMIAAMSGAAVVLCGAFYALFFALAKLQKRSIWMLLAIISYGGLVVFTLLLGKTMNMGGFWQWVIAAMLIGYFAAPHAIWYLCVGTHAGHEEQESESGSHQHV